MANNAHKITSIEKLKRLSYQEALALLPSASSVPRDIYGLDAARKTFPEDVTQQLCSLSQKGEIRYPDELDIDLFLWSLSRINPKGRFGRFYYYLKRGRKLRQFRAKA